MEYTEIIEKTVTKFGRERAIHTLTACAIDLASASLRYQERNPVTDENSPEKRKLYNDLIDRLADMLVTCDLVCEVIKRKDVRRSIKQIITQLEIAIGHAPLP